ncbi:hypothetical protein [Streptomyces sp. WAC01280]|uniref:hypothetical protein n=1 Tax=Streptomyces sp. WAC01280 TaxID=2487424 RepID=UPI000F77C74C|nr:hypothetical protein [Streptomyces sp. WAC01280]RSS59579.1 hypothetical protein EF909_06795 [Streptomyces sp. WAC01280]
MTEILDEHQDDEHDHLDAADFDAFFAEQAITRPRQRITLFGREHLLAAELPLMFTLEAERIQYSSDPNDVRKMLITIFGSDVLDEWAEHGLTDRQLGILLIYSAAAIRSPGTVTMQRAAELHDEQDAEQGKAPAPNRAQRRTKPKRKGGRSGGRS